MGAGRYYRLEGKIAVPCEMAEWGDNFEYEKRKVANDEIAGVRVSTVFLGLDHLFNAHGPPLIFETMIFGGQHDEYQVRTSTWELALEEHSKALDLVKSSLT